MVVKRCCILGRMLRSTIILLSCCATLSVLVLYEMLNFSVDTRSHSLSKQPTQINTVIRDVLNLRAYEHKVNNIEVITILSNELPEITIDRFQMQQVFLNIVLNAEQAMTESHGQGKLTITTKLLDGIIKISFADDGPGIPKEIINRIFDPFFTTKDVGKGTGLGLSICYGIVSNQGGKIHAQSQKGKGTTFVVELPINAG
jgi:signal transduction histidine kinase